MRPRGRCATQTTGLLLECGERAGADGAVTRQVLVVDGDDIGDCGAPVRQVGEDPGEGLGREGPQVDAADSHAVQEQ